MNTIIKTRVVPIGNSRGIRLPKTILDQAGLIEAVEIEASENQLVIRPANAPPRAGWDARFAAMSEAGDDVLLDGEAAAAWDEQWQW